MLNPTNSGIWVSELNALPEIRLAFPRSAVRFYDATLRDGEQTVGVVLSPQQKLEIARRLDALGVDRIFAPSFGDSPAPFAPTSKNSCASVSTLQ